MELWALVLPHVDDVFQVGDGQLLEALLQEVQHFVPGQGLHLCQVLGEDLEWEANQISGQETRYTEFFEQQQQTESWEPKPSGHPRDKSLTPREKTQR